MGKDHDLIIVGSGTTAFAAALKGAERGARVLMVEQSYLGGTCVNWGCVPSKTLIHLAGIHHSAFRGAPFGLNMTAEFPDCGRLGGHLYKTYLELWCVRAEYLLWNIVVTKGFEQQFCQDGKMANALDEV